MSGKSLLAPVLAVALLGSTLPALAADAYTPRPQRTFTDKPRIEDYADYNAFLVDIMEYRRQKAEKARAKAATGTTGAEAVSDATLAGVSGQQQDDITALYQITEPESLEDALVRARQLPHPVYDEPERYGRTTSYSFPIPQMEGDDMSAREVAGLLNDLEAVDPETYEDETAAEQVAVILTGNPDNSDEARDKKASEGTTGIFKPSWDMSTRYVVDSDGNKIWAPIFIENEAGTTIIKLFTIEVGIYKN